MQLSLEKKITALGLLGKQMLAGGEELNMVVAQAAARNKWFTEENIRCALRALAENFLNTSLLEKWISAYPLSENEKPKKIALIMAGNIPLAGFHDLLCVLLTGNIALIKQSSKDTRLLPYLLHQLCAVEPAFIHTFTFVEKLKDFDAVIATGSDNSSRYFEYYFGKYPHIIRKNRNSVAVLTGDETTEQLQQLGNDIFLYFGLGCRNVSKLYVPRGYDFPKLLQALEPFHPIIHHHGYKSNFDYNLTLLIMNKVPHFASDFLMLSENTSISSPLASLYFEYYHSFDEAISLIRANENKIQCVVAGCGIPHAVPFGKSQQPQLADYADGVDTLQFLLQRAT